MKPAVKRTRLLWSAATCCRFLYDSQLISCCGAKLFSLAQRTVFDAFRPNGPSVPIAWPIGPGHGPHTRTKGPTGRQFDASPLPTEWPARWASTIAGDAGFLGRWPRLFESLARWAGIANHRPVVSQVPGTGESLRFIREKQRCQRRS